MPLALLFSLLLLNILCIKYSMYDVIFVTLRSKEATKTTPPPSPDTTTATNDTWYPIDRPVNHKKFGKINHFLVQWLDSKRSTSWEPEDNATQYAIDQYFVETHAKAKRR